MGEALMADCAFYDATCLAGGWLDDLAGGVFSKLETWVIESGISAMKWAVLAWVRTPTPTVDSDSGAVAYLLAYTYPIAFVVATISLLFMTARLAWSQRGEDLVEIFKSLVTFVSVTTLGVAVVSALTVAGDGYSRWILESSLGVGPNPSDTQLAERASELLHITSGTGVSGKAITGLTLVLGFGWLTATSVILIFLTWIRSVILALLAGGASVAAAAGMTPGGKQMLGKYGAWTLAWVTFKPATSTAMATGFWMFGTGDALDMLGGIALIGMTIFMLPFLLRLFVPMAASFGGGAGSAVGPLAAAGAAGAVPVGTWLANRGGDGGGDGDGDANMTVRDVTQGPVGNDVVPAAPQPPQPPQPPANAAPTAGGGAAGAEAGAGAGGAGAGAGAAGAGAAAGGAAAGVAVAGQLVQAGRQAAHGTAAAVTGEES
jgi:hypothetical protein